jgi:TnpA family transposase
MASIERTAYPRFKRALTRHELQTLYTPTADEQTFIEQQTQTDSLRLSMLVLLKTFQHLGYFPRLDKVPAAVVDHVRRALHLPTSVPIGYGHARTLYRHHATIRSYLKVTTYGKQARHVAVLAVYQAAQIMNHPADLINVALAELIHQRYELPAFSTLDHLVQRIRTLVNRRVFQQVLASLSPDEQQVLEHLLTVKPPQRRSDFSRLKDPPPRATLTHLAEWQRRLTWLLAHGEVDRHLEGIPHAKVKHFAAEARALDADGLRDMTLPKRLTLLLSLIHHTRVTTRDQLVTMFLKRMSTLHTCGKDELQALRERQRATTEQLLTVFKDVLHTTEAAGDDATVGHQIRALLHDSGGVDSLLQDCEAIAAYNGNNYLPLVWKFYRSHRSTLFRMMRAIDIRATTQDHSLLTALEYLLTHEYTRKEHIPATVSLGFASEQWQRTVLVRKRKAHVFNRRHFEVCVFSYLAHELKTGDLCVPGSEEYADYREQLLSWEECVPLVPAYCQEFGLPTTAQGFVTHLQSWLAETADRVDQTYPANEQLVINDQGEPTLKRLLRKDPPPGMAELETAIAERMPERSVLDILCSVQHWTEWTRHFGPPSGADPKIEHALEKYLVTTFGYGCNLGPAQTARHTRGRFPDHILTHVHHHHISTPKLEAALRDLINGYSRLGLPKLWGTGQTAAADGTKYDLREQTLLVEYSIRYGSSGGIAYHHVSDMYIALFSHFIACGVWEAIYIIDGLLRNQSDIQPDTVHADTQGQNEPVFGLTHLLGIKLMPRIRNWKELIFYRPSKEAQYRHIDALFRDVIDWKLLETHWQDLLRVVLSIQAGKVLPSTLLRKLTNYSRKNKLYQAFRELGRVVRTVFLLEYIADPQLRRQITAATNKVEAFNGFSAWLFFGGEGMITDSAPEEQEKRIKYKEVIANAVILQNVVDMTQVLRTLSEEGVGISREMAAGLSPYLTRNIKRFGDYTLDMTIPPQPFQEDLPLLR